MVALVVKPGRFNPSFQFMFKVLHVAFGGRADLWDHTCVVITHCLHGDRKKWQPRAKRRKEDWTNHLRALARTCTDDDSWEYELPVFFVDSDFSLIPTAEEERQLWSEPAVVKWLEESKRSIGVLPFRGWDQVDIKDDRLHSMFDFMLFREWARSRSPMNTRDLQTPKTDVYWRGSQIAGSGFHLPSRLS
jgi:hypothetical protein